MEYSEAKLGRIFVIRLHDGDILPDTIDLFAQNHCITRGFCVMIGGVDKESTFVSGPQKSDEIPVEVIFSKLEAVHEILAIGTIFPNENEEPKLHMHAAAGRKDETKTGCIRGY